MYRNALALALCLLASPVFAQDRQVVTARYDYEWVHLNMGDGSNAPGTANLLGAVFMEDIKTSTPGTGIDQSLLRAYIRNGSTGQVILDCNLGFNVLVEDDDDNLVSENANIVEVGPFAQEAHGNAANFLDHAFELINDSLLNPCISHRETLVPDTLTVDCAFQGLPIGTAPGHHTFSSSATYVGDHPSEAGGRYTQRGQHGPIRCILNVDGVDYETHGWLTRMQETRTGINVAPKPIWRGPDGWIDPEDLRPVGLHP